MWGKKTADRRPQTADCRLQTADNFVASFVASFVDLKREGD